MFGKIDTKKRQNKYILINDLKVNLPEIYESEIFTQDKYKRFFYHTFSEKDSQIYINN